MKPPVPHLVLLAFIICSTLGQAFGGDLTFSEEIEPWWKPLQTPKKPFWKRDKTIYYWWKPLKTTQNPVERKPTTSNSWLKPLRATEKPFWKRDNTPYPRWKPLIITEKPFWKQDYSDSYEDNRQDNHETVLLLAVFIAPLAFFLFIIICRIYACNEEGVPICLTNTCEEYRSFQSSQIPRRETPLETSSSRNSRAPDVFSINYTATRRELFSSETNRRSSSNNTRDQPPEYSAVVLGDLVDDLVDGNKISPILKPAIPETPPPKYDDEFLPKY